MALVARRYLNLGRRLLAKEFSRGRERRGRGWASPPVTLSLQPTLSCNLACRMCIQNGPQGYLTPGDPLRKARLPVQTWSRFLEQAAAFHPYVHIWGGEPLLYPELPELVDVVRGLDLTLMLTTNAVAGRKHLETLSRLDVLRISVDGPEAVHDQVRGRPGTFAAVKDLILAVAADRNRRGKARPYLVTNTLVIDETYRHLVETARWLLELPLARSDLSLPMFTTAERGAAYARILETEFGVKPKAWEGFVIAGLSVDIPEVIRSFQEIRDFAPRRRFAVFPPGRIADIVPYYQDLNRTFGARRCFAIYDNLNVLPNGDVTLCNDLPDFIIGNITAQSFEEIWNGEKARAFRRLLDRRLLPVCSRCCLLYSYPVPRSARRFAYLR